jgi:hypothetical protein
MSQLFTVEDESNREYRRFNTVGTQLTVRLAPPPEEDGIDPVTHFLNSMTELFEYSLRNSNDSDMVGISIHNEVNQNDKPIGISFRRKDQLSGDVVWSVLEKVTLSNAHFNALDRLVINIHSVRMPVGFGRVTTKGRQISVMAHLKRSIIEVKASENCLAHALVIAIARIKNDPNYKSYRRGMKIFPAVNALIRETGIELRDCGGIPELTKFQEHLSQYRIVVYSGLQCENIMFDGQVNASTRINLLYDDVNRHNHVITNLTGAMAQRYVCNGCNKGC